MNGNGPLHARLKYLDRQFSTIAQNTLKMVDHIGLHV